MIIKILTMFGISYATFIVGFTVCLFCVIIFDKISRKRKKKKNTENSKKNL